MSYLVNSMNQTQIVKTNNESFKNIRYAFIYSFELIIFIIFLELIIVASINTPFITPIKDVAIKEQEIRAIAVFFGYLFLTTSIAFIVNICLSKENSKLEKIFAIIGIIPFVNIANITYYFFSSFKEKKIISYIINIFSSTNSDRKICYKYTIKMMKNRSIKRDDCLF